MRACLIVLASLFGFAFPQAHAAPTHGVSEIVEHGGGCRKDSPPGKCCHKDSKTGQVHCH